MTHPRWLPAANTVRQKFKELTPAGMYILDKDRRIGDLQLISPSKPPEHSWTQLIDRPTNGFRQTKKTPKEVDFQLIVPTLMARDGILTPF